MNTSIYQVVHHRHRYPNPGKGYRQYTHNTHVISLHLRAKGRCIIGNEPFVFCSPFLGLIAKTESDANDFTGPNEAYWCLFNGDVVQAQPGGRAVTLQVDGLHVHRSHFRLLTTDEVDTTSRWFEQLHSFFRKPDIASRLQANAILGQILSIWAQPPRHTSGHQSKVRLYRTLIEQYADDPRSSLCTLAQQLGATKEHLGVLFHREFGMSPMEYKAQLRLSRAAELLLSSVLPIAEIARLTGFVDPNYFARAFRKTFHCSPRQYATTHKLK